PGARLPHVWLHDCNGLRHSTLDLIGAGYTLLVSDENSPWIAAAQSVAPMTPAPLDVVVIHESQFRAGSEEWEQIAQLGATGALLVRPDQHIAWRTLDAHGDVESRLREAISIASHCGALQMQPLSS